MIVDKQEIIYNFNLNQSVDDVQCHSENESPQCQIENQPQKSMVLVRTTSFLFFRHYFAL